jgi:aminocarboxymuconate-semialdehyde decarboxylase
MTSLEHPTTVDLHAHVFPVGIPDLTAETGDARWPRLVVDETGATGEIRLGDKVFRAVRQPLWDTAARVAAMDRHDVDVQVISPMPVALTYWGDPALALRYAQAFNDQMAAEVQASHGRLRGLGTVPLQDPHTAIAEMERAMGELRLDGIEIGTLIGGSELDEPELRPFFRAAADSGVPLFVHPVDGSGATRCTSPIIDFALGMHTDTSLAAFALVYGGVIAELPGLKVCLSHGGGSFPWTHPRLRMFDPRDPALLDSWVSRLWVDALVFDPMHLPLLLQRFGADHLVLGSDEPFITRDVHDPANMVAAAVDLGVITAAESIDILGANALSFLSH